MVEVDNWFADCTGSSIDAAAALLFPLPEGQSVQAKKVSVGCLNNMFFGIVSE